MKRILKYSIPVLGLALCASTAAHAGWNDGPHPKPPSAPEVDPSLAIGGLTLLGGTLTVMRARNRK